MGNGVTEIGEQAFLGCRGLTNVEIPANVADIRDLAFGQCSSLMSINVASENQSYKSIDGLLLTKDGRTLVVVPAGLENVAIPNGVTDIMSKAFYGCRKLVSIALSSSITNISAGAFIGCSGLKSFEIESGNPCYSVFEGMLYDKGHESLICCPPGIMGDVILQDCVVNIMDYAFSGCAGLSAVILPSSITNVGSYAFEMCNALTRMVIPNSVLHLGEGVFYSCGCLESVELPNGITSIGGDMFRFCGRLSEVQLPEGVTSIGHYAFFQCNSITELIIPESVTSFGVCAFQWSVSLTNITFFGDAPSIYSGTFSYGNPDCIVRVKRGSTGWGVEIPGTWNGLRIEYIDDGNPPVPANHTVSFNANGGNGTMAAQTFTEGVAQALTRNAFTHEGYTFDGWATSAGGSVVYADGQSIAVSSDMTLYAHWTENGGGNPGDGNGAWTDEHGYTWKYCIEDGELWIEGDEIESDEEEWIVVPAVYPLPTGTVVVPSTIAGTPVFGIGSYAFHGCTGLTGVKLPEGLVGIGGNVFEGCTGLKTVMIPEGVKWIGEEAFKDCSGLESVRIPDTVASVGWHAFEGCGDSLFDATALPGFGLVDGWAMQADYGSLPSDLKLAGIRGIGNFLFEDCAWLTSVSIGDGVSNIGYCTFAGCTGLTNVTVSASVRYIDEDAFYSCRNIRRIVFEGDASEVYDGGDNEGAFVDVPSDCVVYVTRGSTGWGVDIPGTWHGMRIEYVEDEIEPQPEPTPEPTPEPEPELGPVVSQQVWTVAFDANGGTGAMSAQTFTNGVAQTLKVNAFRRFGYTFAGWAKSAGGAVVYYDGQRVAITSRQTLYAVWEEITAGALDTGFAKAQTVNGVLYRGDALVGTVQVKVGKISKKGIVKVSATASLLIDGKAKKVTAKAVNVNVGDATGSSDATGRVPPVKVVFKAPIGEMSFEMAADGSFTLKNASYLMAEATIGGALKGGSRGTFRMDGFDLAVPGELLDDLLPNEESFSVSNGKWAFAKAATVKWAKDRVTKEYGLIVDDTKGKTNLSGLKLTYTAKTGQFKGSFKAYALEEKNGKTKLVKYTVNVIGFVVDGVGYGEASCKKPAATWSVTVK